MEVKSRKFEGVFEIVPKIFSDNRGSFVEIFKASELPEALRTINWVQENQSVSTFANTIRGLHFQIPPFEQAKFVRVPKGSILDIVVDLRKNSQTYGTWDAVEINSTIANSLFIPSGFAHGFRTLEPDTIVQYKVNNRYSKEMESGIIWSDLVLDIDWGVDAPILSEKDLRLPTFEEFTSPFLI
ncbi:MAG: dTDP-4-dehydrorhamnose 3,5-epimerase [Pyrinomonadaceae bacterium]